MKAPFGAVSKGANREVSYFTKTINVIHIANLCRTNLPPPRKIGHWKVFISLF